MKVRLWPTALTAVLCVVLASWPVLPAAAAPGATRLVSQAPDGTPANGNSDHAAISADGSAVAFTSSASNLVDRDTNETSDVFVRDLGTGRTTRVSVGPDGAEANGQSTDPSISDDGRYVAYTSRASNLVVDDTNNTDDVFVHDRLTGQTTRVSVPVVGLQSSGGGTGGAISGDGRRVGFYSQSPDLVPGGTFTPDIYVHDRVTGGTTLVTRGWDGSAADGPSYFAPSLSQDGELVAFRSFASNIVPGDTNGKADTFVHEMSTSRIWRVSVSSAGTQANGDSVEHAISADGRYVALSSVATNLVDGDTNGARDVFVHNRLAGTTRRVSVASDGTQANGHSVSPAISPDGQLVSYTSSATTLVPDDAIGTNDVFAYDYSTGETTKVSISDSGTGGNGHSRGSTISAFGARIAYQSSATNIVDGDTNGIQDIYVQFRNGVVTPPPPNGAPTVDAGPDVAGDTGAAVPLDGTAADPDADPITTSWTVSTGDCTVAEPSAVDTTITCGTAGDYTATLTANDGINPPVSDTAQVTVTDPPPPNGGPTVDAGPDVAGDAGAPIVLDATVSDPDGDELRTAWEVDSEACTFADASAVDTAVTCTTAGVYTVTLSVGDLINPPVRDTAQVTVTDLAPPPGDAAAALAAAGDLIGSLDQSSFKRRGQQTAMLSVLDDVATYLDAGDPGEARALVTNLISRVDGCGDEPDKHDWIFPCDDQTAAREALADLRDAIIATAPLS